MGEIPQRTEPRLPGMNAVDGSFGAILSLDGSAFGVGRGETVALFAADEVGKSTWARTRTGVHVRDVGGGEDVRPV